MAASLPGCFDGGALLDAQEEVTNLVRLEEIDLGEFRITLPHAPGEPGGAVVELHAFGKVELRDRDAVAEALGLNAPELRYRILLLVRSLSRKQLEEPRLQSLREAIAKLANASLEKPSIKSVGFYKFAMTSM